MRNSTSSRKRIKTSVRPGPTIEEKLHALEKLWGYVEATRVLLVASGERKYCVRNYSGSLIDEMWALKGLPGNPRAKRKIEITGRTREEAIRRAYRTMKPFLTGTWGRNGRDKRRKSR